MKKIRTISILIVASLIFIKTGAQEFTENHCDKVVIRSGLKAAAGYSKLYLSDEIRPLYNTNDFFPFEPDFCVKVGAMLTMQSPFLGEKFQFIFDPAFTKYSYGNSEEKITSAIVSSVDVDIDAIEIPFSLRYNLVRQQHKVRPYLRAGISFSYFVDTDAVFIYEDLNGMVYRQSDTFNFSAFQDAASFCAGVEFDLPVLDIEVEIVAEKGDGIYKEKFGGNFLDFSNTQSVYLQTAVLF